MGNCGSDFLWEAMALHWNGLGALFQTRFNIAPPGA
jgi:hypothetical protein